MPEQYHQQIAHSLNLKPQQVAGTLALLAEGGTVPFIARYRKEATDSLDEVAITAIRDRHQQLQAIDQRRQAILDSLAKSGQESPELQQALAAAGTLSELEDIYLPYRPKRRTRAQIARQKGLAPLAAAMLGSGPPLAPETFLQAEEGLTSLDEVLAGARDIVAETIAEEAAGRAELRALFRDKGVVNSQGTESDAAGADKYRDYFDRQEPVARTPGHRLHAMFRGEREKFLRISLRPPEEAALRLLRRRHLRPGHWHDQLELAICDSYRRLLAPSLENELRQEVKERADSEAIRVFADNLRQLLLAPPLGQKRVLAIDPGYRTGGKVVCLDGQGSLLASTTIYPTGGEGGRREAAAVVNRLVAEQRIEAVAIGSGTAGRETESFVRGLGLPEAVLITLVNEDGASIYSASEAAREEFPELDLTLRGAISIGRRLQDPLAELVKIDPAAIGVGQYQHDVDQGRLREALTAVVTSCVNSVGVELNSASARLLTFVAGLGPALAAAIFSYRQQHGPFSSRRQLLKVPRLGPRAFQQCAGFLRIRNAANPLDGSGVHPERYALVARMAADQGLAVATLLASAEARQAIDPGRYVDAEVGLPTLSDIVEELARPGRDPRPLFRRFRFAEGVHEIGDLHEGMRLPAIITNVTAFGAFADIGIKENGLIHISELADRRVKNPAEVVRLGQQLEVRVVGIDLPRKRIALSLRPEPGG